MRIDGITCCSGELYAGYLKKSLQVWLDTLDSLTIVTKPDDAEVLSMEGPSNLKIVTTNVFTEHGAYFNKGAALNYAYNAADPSDWCLCFDADIKPPVLWRDAAESTITVGNLYGAARQTKGAIQGKERAFLPLGYFQLWNVLDTVSLRWPMFTPWYEHCGIYDVDLSSLWRPSNRKKLDFVLDHQGVRREHWFGVGHKGLMRKLMQIGLVKYRQDALQTGRYRLKVPAPALKIGLLSYDPKWSRELIRSIQVYGPFKVWMRQYGKEMNDDWILMSPKTSIEKAKEKVLALLSERSFVHGR